MKKLTVLSFLLPLFLISCSESNHAHGPEETTAQEVSVTHVVSDNTKKMNLPFSDAVIVDNMVYLSGVLGNKPGSFELVEGGIRPETRQTMENIKTALASIDLSMDDIIKCTVFIEDIEEWGIFNEEYVKFFPNKKPARSALGADGLALGARVEVECMACRKK